MAGLALATLAVGTVPGASRFLWSGVVPLLPVLFLLHPGLWRNVCPLATLGMGPEAGEGAVGDGVGWACLLLLVLLPLRPLGLDGSGAASAGLLLAVAGGAAAGRRRPRKAGFCNRWCPLLPVERLYGQRPLLELSNPRCPRCTLCTPRGCLDLSPRAATAQLLGADRRTHRWLLTPLGAFAAAFPGVVLAFFLLPAEPAVARAYGQVALGGAASWGLVGAALRITRAGWQEAFPALGALSAALYLGFALPGAAGAWGVPEAAPWAGGAGVALAAAWGIRALRSARPAAPRIP